MRFFRLLWQKAISTLRYIETGGVGSFALLVSDRLRDRGLLLVAANLRLIVWKCRYLNEKIRSRKRQIVFTTFADGSVFTSKRIVSEVNKVGIFSQILPYDAESIGVDFHETFADHLKCSRGYGFWAWKPYLINKIISQLQDGDILFYADAGCSLSSEADCTLREIVLKMLRGGANIVVSRAYADWFVRQWTKMDLLVFLGFNSHQDILDAQVYEANRLALMVNSSTRAFVKQWLEVAQDLHLIDDSPSIHAPEHADFREHRHDQSIFNLLLQGRAFETGIESAFGSTRIRA